MNIHFYIDSAPSSPAFVTALSLINHWVDTSRDIAIPSVFLAGPAVHIIDDAQQHAPAFNAAANLPATVYLCSNALSSSGLLQRAAALPAPFAVAGLGTHVAEAISATHLLRF